MSGRKQFVEIDGVKSTVIDSLNCSTIQGSKLSYILYICYISEVTILDKIMDTYFSKLITLRDQTQIYTNLITHYAMNFIDDSSNVIASNDTQALQNYINDFL